MGYEPLTNEGRNSVGFFLWAKKSSQSSPDIGSSRIFRCCVASGDPTLVPASTASTVSGHPRNGRFWLVRGTPKPSFLGVISRILGVSNLHFSWFWGPRVVRKTKAVVGSQVVEVETLRGFFWEGNHLDTDN